MSEQFAIKIGVIRKLGSCNVILNRKATQRPL